MSADERGCLWAGLCAVCFNYEKHKIHERFLLCWGGGYELGKQRRLLLWWIQSGQIFENLRVRVPPLGGSSPQALARLHRFAKQCGQAGVVVEMRE